MVVVGARVVVRVLRCAHVCPLCSGGQRIARSSACEGVIQSRVCRGRLLSSLAMLSSSVLGTVAEPGLAREVLDPLHADLTRTDAPIRSGGQRADRQMWCGTDDGQLHVTTSCRSQGRWSVGGEPCGGARWPRAPWGRWWL